MARRSVKEGAGEYEEIEMQITPLIDVVFLLLVFFLSSIHFRTLEGFLQANIPPAAPPPPEKMDNVTITLVDVGNALELKVNTVVMKGSTLVELYKSLEEHLAAIQKTYLESGRKMPLVVIDAQKEMRYKYVVSTLNVCGKLKIDNVSFVLPDDQAGTGTGL